MEGVDWGVREEDLLPSLHCHQNLIQKNDGKRENKEVLKEVPMRQVPEGRLWIARYKLRDQ